MQELIYHDKTPMPFGQHKGVALCNVPAQYLLYLWDTSEQGQRLSDAKLAKYISDNFHVIEMEAAKERQRKFYERK